MTRRRSLLIFALVIVVTLVLARLFFREQLEPQAILETLRATKGHWWVVPAYMVLYFASTALLMPASLMAVVAGAVWGFETGWVIAIAASNLASNAQFSIGRWFGAARVKPWLERRGLEKLVSELEQRGAFTMLVVRQLPLPFVAVNVAAGASPMTWVQFAIGNAIGLLPNVTIYTYFAAALADGVEGARGEALLRAVAAGATLTVTGLVSRWLMRRRETPA